MCSEDTAAFGNHALKLLVLLIIIWDSLFKVSVGGHVIIYYLHTNLRTFLSPAFIPHVC